MGGMVITDSMAFAASSLLAAVVLLVIAYAMKAAAATHTRRKGLRLRGMAKDLEGQCAGLEARLAEVQADLRVLEAEEAALVIETTQARRTCTIAAQDTFEIIHEVGTPGSGNAAFDVEILLSPAAMNQGPAATQTEPRVWSRRNIARIWAPSPQEALQLAGRVFPVRYGYVITRFLNASIPGFAEPT
ncbi:hypothetical protein [Rhodospirillum centenum]|uniref:Uncharacterized protein n=1 Tax=Rhodospirillum centenum (strain ATCC 51521 / SW) TaxID=414684 RepID=B6IXW2_RHOCS|nr:hypothetical protein [Rhodospirillum centenum]ACJ01136.1 hypothetical protein RC1_3793 [Rhodospirillum centenum SW]